MLTAREAPGEAEDQNGGQGGEGADARMLEVGGRREQENKSVPKFLLDRSWVEDLPIQGRSSGGLSEARMTPLERLRAVRHAKVRKNVEKEPNHVYACK